MKFNPAPSRPTSSLASTFASALRRNRGARPFSIALVGTALGLLLTPVAHAASRTWSGTASTAWATGGASGNWSTAAAPVNDLTTDTANFNSATYTNLPNAGTTSITGITVGAANTSGTLVISGTALSLGASGVTIASGSGAVGISATSTKIGASQSWANNSAGLFTVSGGITNVGNVAPFTLTINGSGAGGTTLSGAITNGGATGTTKLIINTTGGATTLSGTNTYSGGTTLSLGTLNINAAGALGGASAGVFTIGSNSATTTISNTAAGGAVVLTTTTGTQTWNGNFTFTGANNLTFNTGAITLTADTIANISSSTLTEGANAGIGGAFKLTKSGAGTLVLNGTNTYSGGTTITGGTLTLAGSNVNQGAVTLTGGTLNINHTNALGSAAITISGGTLNNTSAGAVTLLNNNVQAWNGNFAFTGTQALNLGTGAVTLGAASITVTANGSNALTVGGAINGSGSSLIKAGPGTLILSGTNTYDGGTTIRAGVLEFVSTAAIGGTGANVLVNFGGTAAFGYALDQTTLDDPTNGRIVLGSQGTVALSANTSNNLDFSGAGLTSLSLGASLGTYTYSGTLWTPANNVYRLGGGGGNLVVSPAVSGANSLLVGGSGSGGTVTLASAGTYSGGTTVTGATGIPTVGAAGGASLLQTNVLAGTSTTPFGSDMAITLDNGALGLGTAGALNSGDVMNVAGYNVTYSGQNSINLAVGGGSSVTFAANSLTRVNHGVLIVNPTSGATLGSTEKVTLATGAPVVTNGMVSPNFVDGTTRNFLTYDATNGFKDVTYTVNLSNAFASGGGLGGPTDIVNMSLTTNLGSMGGNEVINALKLTSNSTFNTNFFGSTGEMLTLASGGIIFNMQASGGYNLNATNADINFGTGEGFMGSFSVGGGSAPVSQADTWIGSGGFTLYGNAGLTVNNIQTTGGINIAGGNFRMNSGGFSANPNNIVTIGKAGSLQWGAASRPTQFLGLAGDGQVLFNATTSAFTGNNELVLDGLNGTGTTTFSGVIQDGGNSSYNISLTKYGSTNQVLTGANDYFGATKINGGTLTLDFSATGAPTNNIINNSAVNSALTLAGGKLNVIGGAVANTQQFAGVTIGSGNSAVNLTTGSNGDVPLVALGGTFSRSQGGTVDFGDAGNTGNISTTASLLNIVNGVWTSTAANPTAFATVNGTDWATIFGGSIAATSGYSGTYTSTNNVDVTNGDAPSIGSTVNTLRFNAANTGLTLAGTNTIGTGGILNTAAGTSSTISGGTLVSGIGKELVIINNGNLTIGSVLANSTSGASVLTLSGSGTTTLNGNNTFTGNSFINSGTVVIGNGNALGTTAGTLTLNGGTLASGSTVSLNAKPVTIANNSTIGGSHDITLLGLLTNGGRTNILTVNNTANTTLTTINLSNSTTVGANVLNIAGSGNVSVTGLVANGTATSAGLTYSGTGTLTLGNAANTYTGTTKISSGTISIGTLANGGVNSSIGASAVAASNLVLDGGTLKYSGAVASTDRLFNVTAAGGTIDASGSGALTFSSTGSMGFGSSPGTRTLTLTGTSTNANTLNTTLTDAYSAYATSIAKTGAGTWALNNAANTYTGGTTISGGKLISSVAGSLGNTSGTLAINGGGTLDINNVAQTVGVTTLGTVGTSTGSTIQSTGGTKTLTTSGVTVNGTGNTIASSVSVTGVVTQSANSGLTVNGTVGADTLGTSATLAGTGTVGAVTLSGSNTLSSAGTLTTGGLTVNGLGNSISSGIITGAITQNSGSALAVNGTAGADTLNGSSILTGTGTVGALTLNAGATISPGTTTGILTSTGTLTWNGGSTLAFNLSTTDNSSTRLVLNSLVKGTAGLFNVDLTGGLFTAGTTYELVDFGSLSGFTVADFTQTGSSGLVGNFVLTGNQLDFTVLAVPEPGTWAMMLGGLGCLIFFQSKRRRS